jgi:hypothetical protein
VTSPATDTTTSAFPGELTTQAFQTSCQVFDGSLLTLLDVQVSVNATDNSGSVEVRRGVCHEVSTCNHWPRALYHALLV